MPKHNAIEYPVQEIAARIAQGETQQQIADDLAKRLDPRITAKLIYKVCKKHGIECQRTGPRSGEGHPYWRGGVVYEKGYRFVYCPDHHECIRINEMRRAKSEGKYYRKEKYVSEHRLVMEQHLGRPLLAGEVVHHRNGQTADNRIENLELFSSNSRHLAETLRGHCPKWTPRGLANMRAAAILRGNPDLAQKYSYQQIAVLLLAIQKALKLDVPPSKIEFDHYLAERGITAERACEMALQQELQPAA